MNFNHIFNSQTKTVTFAAALLAFSAIASRLLGLVRDRLLAGRFGAGQDLDVYFAAFRIPDLIYGILIMGGVSVIFLPVLAEYFKKDEKEGWQLANVVLNCFLVLLVAFCGILAILTPWILKFITPGFAPEQRELAVSLTRIMFLSPIFLGLSSIFSGILHYFNRFLAYSIAPILYNLGIIFGIIFFVPVFGLIGLAYGVIMGALLHLLFQIPAAKVSGFHYRPVFNFKYPGLLKIFKLMTFRTIGASVSQINLIAVTAIASTLTAGSIAVFNFANNLSYFPIGVIGTSFAMASFPALSRAWVNGAKAEFLDNFSSTFRQIVFLVIPISFLMFLLRAQIVRLILGSGQFTWRDTQLTAASLGLLSLSIFAFALVPFLLRLFFSFQDVKTPTVVGLIYMAITIATLFFFVWLLGFPNLFQKFVSDILDLDHIENIQTVSMPLAVSFSGIIYFSLLLILLRRKMGHMRLMEIWHSFKKIIAASALMTPAVYFALRLSDNFVGMTTFGGVLFQAVFAFLAGAIVFIIAAYFLHSPELRAIKFSILRQFAKPIDKK